MSAALTYPGVYVQELPSGSRTVTGVSTSLTAFVGPACRGPVNRPTRVSSFSDFERRFGGLWSESAMSQAVRQYFQNSGREAVIVRIVNGDTSTPGAAATRASLSLPTAPSRMILVATSEAAGLPGFHHLELTVTSTGETTFDLLVEAKNASGTTLANGSYTVALDTESDIAASLQAASTTDGGTLVELEGPAITVPPQEGPTVTQREAGVHHAALFAAPVDALALQARNEGAWGSGLRASVAVRGADPGAFHLTLHEVDDSGKVVAEEVFHNVTAIDGDTRAIDRILELESELALVSGDMPVASTPVATSTAETFTSGSDGNAPRMTEDWIGSEAGKTGIYALLDADLFNILCLPLASWSTSDAATVSLWSQAAVLCEQRRAFLIIDPPSEWSSPQAAATQAADFTPRSANAGLYFPRIEAPDPLQEGRLVPFPPCGVVAGILARTDADRGIWKAPAGLDATARGVPKLVHKLTDAEQGRLHPLGINCLRTFAAAGTVVWGARTLFGADIQASQWKHVPVRRLALFLEESLFRGTRWAVFEPNDEPLWGEIRLGIGAFMHRLFRQGAFQGRSPREAYFVKCDAETTTPADQARGRVNIVVGFAPLRPAEFVIIKLQQMAAQAG